MEQSDATHCRRIVRAYARTFWLASGFLPPDKRRAAFALYAFCRVADDIVDLGVRDESAGTARLLRAYRCELDAALGGQPSGPVFRELAAAAERYRVPPAVLVELLDGVACDCAPASYDSWHQLSVYCEGVASSVGEMCTYVFGVSGDRSIRARALTHARTLGVAMQLTNILRDVGEDARNGRCYLPTEDLTRFGLTRDEVLACTLGGDERWNALMRFQIDRARALYAQATPGIALLSPDARRCATACAVGYAGILRAIENLGYDTFSSRARVGTMARAGVLWSAWRTPLTSVVQDSANHSVNDGTLVRWT
ncbi:MAG: phytoene/squalene synthase family protein [Gemmatimonadaceae bacterium]